MLSNIETQAEWELYDSCDQWQAIHTAMLLIVFNLMLVLLV